MRPKSIALSILFLCLPLRADVLRIESPRLAVEVDSATGRWSLRDQAGRVSWPTQGQAGPAAKLPDGVPARQQAPAGSIVLAWPGGTRMTWALADDGQAVDLRWDGPGWGDVSALGDALSVTDAESGYVVVPCREGLLIPADSGVAFHQGFGTSDYEGCHMNMLALGKAGSTLLVTWDDAYTFPAVASVLGKPGQPRQKLSVPFALRRSARTVRLYPLGPGDWNTIAAEYRRIAQAKGLAVTLDDKIARNAHLSRMVGASNVKLWTCLARKMSEDSKTVESVTVCWTFDEAGAVAEHLSRDLKIDRCLFILGGWTEGGYDCRHPDDLPANPECGGNDALARTLKRAQDLGYVACLHDNYQDMYRDAKSWDLGAIEKKPDGSPIVGGRWLGGRAFMVCASKQLELARRPQNLPQIKKLFDPWCYFIDCTYAVGPRECSDPKHPLDRNQDIAIKSQLSDYARGAVGLFGSECGREWALPHSDFFEGLSGVAGKYYHNLDPGKLGAVVIPFWEMVYHDCQIVYGKYGYPAQRAGEYVAHHVLCGRPLNYHSIPHHLYWQTPVPPAKAPPADPSAAFTRSDDGWTAGLCPTDVFLKNTHEVLGPLHAATARQRLEKLEFLDAARRVRRATFGQGEAATVVQVNFGPGDAEVVSRLGQKVLLPAYGFVVDAPGLAAFYARRWGGVEYPGGAMFTLRAPQGQTLDKAARVTVFHAFGEGKIAWRGKVYAVAKEGEID